MSCPQVWLRLLLVLALVAWPRPALAEELGASASLQPAAPMMLGLDSPEPVRDYPLNVGDTMAINLWASSLRFSQQYVVPFEGKIYVPSLGELDVARKTTEQVRSELMRRLGARVPGLQASVLLVSARSISVYVTGLVKNPGLVPVPVLARLGTALAQAGGILPEGSARRITLRRQGQKPRVIDWYRFQFRGDMEANPRLSAGDVINVPTLGAQATIEGAVYQPGTYEVLPGETVGELVDLAHGLKAEAAASQASLAHVLTDTTSDRREAQLDLSLAASRRQVLRHQDRLYIPTNTLTYIPMNRTKVHIQGEIFKEGTYTLTVGQTLRDLFAQAGGPKPSAGLREVKIFGKAFAGASQDAPTLVNAYSMLYEGSEAQNVTLHDGDLVLVPANRLPAEDAMINVHGQVGKPGRVPFRVGARLSDYLNQAGGPTARANLGGVTITRRGQSIHVDAHRIMREGRSDGDVELQAGDIVDVPEAFFYVGNFQDLVNLGLAALAVWAAVRPLTSGN